MRLTRVVESLQSLSILSRPQTNFSQVRSTHDNLSIVDELHRATQACLGGDWCPRGLGFEIVDVEPCLHRNRKKAAVRRKTGAAPY